MRKSFKSNKITYKFYFSSFYSCQTHSHQSKVEWNFHLTNIQTHVPHSRFLRRNEKDVIVVNCECLQVKINVHAHYQCCYNFSSRRGEKEESEICR